MPNTKSAKKALRQSKRHYVQNLKRKRALKDVLKKFEKAVLAKNKSEAQTLFVLVQKALDKSAKTRIITRNTSRRKKSRLSVRLNKLA